MAPPPASTRSLLLASCVGTSIEWYDYYGVADPEHPDGTPARRHDPP